MLKQRLDSVKDPYIKAFLWRVYNVFKSFILPLIAYPVLLEAQRALQETGDLSPLMCSEFWYNILFIVVLVLIGSSVAGLDKIRRME